jgi:Mor family transcriptional regulator
MNIRAILAERGVPKSELKKLWIRKVGPYGCVEIHYQEFDNYEEIEAIQKMLRKHFSFILKQHVEGRTFYLRAWP